ncbi:MAG: hypothetical protein EHM79_10975 [Geobacter sp.]|nr:MAG: hypothetical protein EHM79_10975 [Geobacter sp.]
MSDVQKQVYYKPALTLDEQIDLLTTRGLTVPDRDKACHYPRYIGYYRLSGYFLTLRHRGNGVQPHTFFEGITFKDVLDIYIFDREPRLLVMDAIERIVVAFRACISNTMSKTMAHTGSWTSAHFVPRFKHADMLEKLKRETYHQLEKSRPRLPLRAGTKIPSLIEGVI